MTTNNSVSEDLDFIRVATPVLKQLLSEHKCKLNENQYHSLIEDIRKRFNNYSAVLAEFHPGPGRAKAAHELMETAMGQTQMIQYTCSKGCGNCCHLEVEITQDEGELLGQIVDSGFEIDMARLKTQASRERKSSDWSPMIRQENRCVFLGADQCCQVYESRPLVCRKALMASDPVECSKENGNINPIQIPLAEIVLSAALSQPANLYQSLSKHVLGSLEKLQKVSAPAREDSLPIHPESVV